MTRLSWNTPGERFYETGLDRGVLYAPDHDGVAWTGLISVAETTSGGDPKPYYIDGIKYLNLSSAEEFVAIIDAFSSPAEFGPCDGTVSIQNGLFVTQQPRQSFGFCYRTRVGNDTEGPDHGYKIHLVYNALAAPPKITSKTIDDSVNPIIFSWSITTLAPVITGYRPTAHMMIDSRITSAGLLGTVEDILYGDESAAPRLPDPDELITMFTA